MNVVVTGTPETRTVHNQELAVAGLALSVLVPFTLGLAGFLSEGPGAISWSAAIAWGALAALAYTIFGALWNAAGLSSIDLFDLLGSTVAAPHTTTSRAMGFLVHHAVGAVLAIGWAFAAALFEIRADAASAVVWAVLVSGCGLLMLSTVGVVHPAIRRGREEDPGAGATHFGRWTPMGLVLGHVVYGVVLGYLYRNVPLS